MDKTEAQWQLSYSGSARLEILVVHMRLLWIDAIASRPWSN